MTNTAVSDPSLGDFFKAIYRKRKLFLGVLVGGTAISLAIALVLPRSFVANTLVLPPQQPSVMQGALAQLGNLASFAGAGATKSPEDMYVVFFQTRRLQDALIKQFDLQKHYEEPSLESARQRLAAQTSVSADKKTGLITIEVTDADAALATRVANSYVTQMQQMLSSIAVTESQQRYKFLEVQVTKAREDLRQVEAQFERAQLATGFVVPDAMAEMGVRESVQLRGAISAKEIELQAIASALTPNNPHYKKLNAELSALKGQLQSVEQGRGVDVDIDGRMASPALPLYRDMKVRQGVLEQLIRQLEATKLEVAKEGPFLQQIDVAVQPEVPTKPKRLSIVILGFLISALLATAIALKRGLRIG